MVHCAQCGKALNRGAIRRCDRCGMPFCRAHMRKHECDPTSREKVLSWATSFDRPEDEEKGSLPSGATYARLTIAHMYRTDVAERALLWLAGIGFMLLALTDWLPFVMSYRTPILGVGALAAGSGALMLAKVISKMHSLSGFATVLFAALFLAIPGLVAALLL